ncbi:hypothetical protein Btru_066667 [Bulinus truncatus]|nr:hypothetical protein Btru_066667 [Bulinus truncatus]
MTSDSQSEDRDGQAPPGLCCLPGCLAGTGVGVAFFAALPTGIILVVLSASSHDIVLLALGSVLIALPVLVLIMIIILCFNKKRLPCNTK